MVEDVVDSLSNDQIVDLEVGPSHDGVYLEARRKDDSNLDNRVVQDF